MNNDATSTGNSSGIDEMSLRRQRFHSQVLDLAGRFTAKEAARAFLVTTQFMRDYGVKNGIEFATQDGRSPEQSRRLRKELEQLKEEARIRQMKPILPSPGPDGLKLPPALEARSRKALWESENKFVTRLVELGKTHTMAQVQRMTGLNQRSLRRLAYDHGITFADQVEAFNEDAANAELVAASRRAFALEGMPDEAQRVISTFLLPRSPSCH